MRKNSQNLLKHFASKNGGKQALSSLFNALESTANASSLVVAENEFLLSAASITGEKPASQTTISGNEADAHELLRLVLIENETNGLKHLRNSLNIR